MGDIVSGDTGHVTEHNRLRHLSSGRIWLDSFDGASDTAKLAAAISYAGAQTYAPVIALSNRKYTFTAELGRVYDGFTIEGPADSWKSSAAAKQSGCEVALNLTPRAGEPAGYWLEATSGTIWNWAVRNIYFSGTGSTQFLRAKGAANGGGLLDGCTFHSLQFNGFRTVFGNGSEKCAMQLCVIDGYWSIQGCTDTACRIGGSDNRGIFADGLNIDSGASAGGKYHMIFDYCSKSNVGPVYVNCDSAGWRGVKILGNNANADGLDFYGVTIEGRNATNAAQGELVTVQGGWPHFHGGTIDCGMTSPSAGEVGMISVVGSTAHATFDGVCIDLASGQDPASISVFYVGSGGEINTKNIRRMQRDTGSPAWGANLPSVYAETGTIVHKDDTVTQRVA
jgi:hypothetical protein